ncbi:beta-lactamase induction protein [Frateuria aurantia]
MTSSLVIILIAVGLLHRWPQLAAYRRDTLFLSWLGQIGRVDGAVHVTLALGVPVLLCLLIIAGIGVFPGHALGQCAFALVVLLFCLGPRELAPDIAALQSATTASSQLQALTDLHDETMTQLAWEQGSVAEAVAYAALHRRFGVVFWFVLLGPPGALLYRLSQTLGRDASLDLTPGQRKAAQYTANALDWLPAHGLVFTLAVVDHWDAVIQAWRDWHRVAGRAGWYGAEPGFLGAAARCSSISPNEGSGSAVDTAADPAHTAARLLQVFRRAWISWLAVLALLAAGGWISRLS